MKKKNLIVAFTLYVISSLVSYGVFAQIKPVNDSSQTGSTSNGTGADATDPGDLILDIDADAPRDQECPISGKYYTQVEKEAWEKRRPLFVIIENSPDARPQSGLNSTDVVYEAVAEGGITRYGAVFYCDAQKQNTVIAPVRSVRTYFNHWASGYNKPLYVHVGGANLPGKADAIGQIREYGWDLENDLNQFSISYPTYKRNTNRIEGKTVATEHTMETYSEALWDYAKDNRGWTNMSPDRKYGTKVVEGSDWIDDFTKWKFEDQVGEKGDVTEFSYDFWSGYNAYSVKWVYSAEKDSYLRYLGGEEDIDMNNDQQVNAVNVIVLKTNEIGPIDELKHLLYDTIGTGKALIFKHGQLIEANWSKSEREARIKFTNASGQEIELGRGRTWISVVDTRNEVTY